MTVVATTITHNIALGTTVPNAPHFLCPAKVSAHICLLLMYITLDQKIVPTLPNLCHTTHYFSTYTSPSLVHLCNNRQADSTSIVPYMGRQFARTVLPNVDIVGRSKCHTRHWATGGVSRYVLDTNSNPVMTFASSGHVNPFHNSSTSINTVQVPGQISSYIWVQMKN